MLGLKVRKRRMERWKLFLIIFRVRRKEFRLNLILLR